MNRASFGIRCHSRSWATCTGFACNSRRWLTCSRFGRHSHGGTLTGRAFYLTVRFRHCSYFILCAQIDIPKESTKEEQGKTDNFLHDSVVEIHPDPLSCRLKIWTQGVSNGKAKLLPRCYKLVKRVLNACILEP